MQPTYLPWSGYFNLLSTADVFVFLDDAQFQRKSWHCRNQILISGTARFLSVPVLSRGRLMAIDEAEIDYSRDWRREHEDGVREAYGATMGGPTVLELLGEAWNRRPRRLLDLNLAIIRSICGVLNIRTPLRLASELQVGGQRSERLLSICEHLGVTDYLSPSGSAGYLEQDGFAASGRVALHFQNFVPAPYPQRDATDFVPYMSVIDVIAQCGVEEAAAYVRRPSFPSYPEHRRGHP